MSERNEKGGRARRREQAASLEGGPEKKQGRELVVLRYTCFLPTDFAGAADSLSPASAKKKKSFFPSPPRLPPP